MNNLPQYLYDSGKFDTRFSNTVWDQVNNISHSIPAIIQEPAKTVWDQMTPYINDGTVFVAAGAIAVLAVSFLGLRSLMKAKAKPTGDGEMRHWQRQQELQRIVSDLLCDVIEEARYKDLITRAEKNRLYAQMGKFFSMPDLLVQRHPSRKKAEIRQRIGNGVYKTKPHIPGDAPETSVPVVKQPKRNRLVLKKTMRIQPAE